MSAGLKLLSSAIQNGASNILLTLESQYLVDRQEESVLDFARSYYREYDEMPSLNTVFENTRVRLPRADGPLKFHLDNVYERYDYEILRDSYAEMRELLKTGKPAPVVNVMEATIRRIRRTRKNGTLIDAHQGIDLVTSRLREALLQGGVSGVPSPWPYYNDQTGGSQPADLITYVGRMAMGKCMHPDTPVIMANGRVRAIKTLKVGDQLLGPDSLPKTVLSTTTGREEMFKITPTRGEPWVCNRSHILVLECTYDVDRIHRKGGRYCYSVSDFLALPGRVRDNLRLVRTGVEFARKPVEFDPYIVGVWLGDGSVGSQRISNPDPEVIAAIHDFAEHHGYRVSNSEQREGACPVWGIVGVQGKANAFRDFVTVDCYKRGQKRIPQDYLVNDREQRLALLAGLVDTDGYTERDAVEIITQYEGLRDDILFLARSLGLSASWSVKTVEEKPYYRIRMFGATDQIPARVARKRVHAVRVRRSDPMHSTFTVTSEGQGDYFGITLPGDHLYLLGDFTITHNTALLLAQHEHAFDSGYSTLFVTTEMGSEQIARRWMAMRYGINPDNLKKGTVSTYLLRKMEQYKAELYGRERFRLMSLGTGAKLSSVEVVIEEIRPDIVFIDGIYLFQPNKANGSMKQSERVTHVFDELKQQTLDTNIPHVVTTQFNRQAGKGGKDGTLESIGLSDAIGQHSSIVVAVKSGPTENPRDSLELEFLKGREGEEGKFAINFKFRPVDFSQMTQEELERIDSQQTINVDHDWT